MSVNKFIGIGHLGKDPELRFLNSGKAVCNFSIAMSEQWMKEGQKQEKTEWVNIVTFDKLAENCSQYLQKGRQVYVEGKLQTRSYDDKEGNKRYVTEIVAQNVKFLGGNPSAQQSSGFAGASGSALDDDVPFIA
jgi:single-strand DNA-binding protein